MVRQAQGLKPASTLDLDWPSGSVAATIEELPKRGSVRPGYEIRRRLGISARASIGEPL